MSQSTPPNLANRTWRWRRRSKGVKVMMRPLAPALALLGGVALWATQASAPAPVAPGGNAAARSEEHTSELQSQSNLVCRLLLEKKKNPQNHLTQTTTQPSDHPP